ncbi:MAG: hypothetical protein JW751_01180 [Polyangiaceae bacterium]|nr:hypothetical protein [Polyangiaceae bacterium]
MGWVDCVSGVTYPGLTDGEHALAVRTIDRAGNVDPEPAEHTWTLDTTLPDTFVWANRGELTNQTSIEFTFDATEEGCSFQCRLDAGAWGACTSPRPYTGLVQGTHTFAVRATDAVDLMDPSPATFDWVIDLTPPDTWIAEAPPNPDNDTTPTFVFESEVGATFQCRRDSGAWTACTSPYTWPTTAEGSHTFRVRAIDAAGNLDATEDSYTWTIDTTPPVVTITSGPSGPHASTTATFEFTSEPGATFECQLDTGAWTACTSPQSYPSLGQGSHTFSVRASDVVPNTGIAATRSLTVDTVAPSTTLTGGPGSGTCQTTDSASFSFTASESGATFECQLDTTGAWASCSSPRGYTALSQGSHTFHVRATDPAHNVGAEVTRTWTVDTIAPDTSLSGPSGTASSCAGPFVYTFSGEDSFECSVDGGAYAACTSPRSMSWTSGTHAFAVRAVDTCGNRDASPSSRSLTVNNCGTGCTCSGTTPTETACGDGQDNDYDAATDCADADCNGQTCKTGSGALGIVQDCTLNFLSSLNVCDGSVIPLVGADYAAFTVDAPPSQPGLTYSGTFVSHVQVIYGPNPTVAVYSEEFTTVLGTCIGPGSGIGTCTVSLNPTLNGVAGTGTFDLIMVDSGNQGGVLATEYPGTEYDPSVSYTYTSVCTNNACPIP